MDFPLIDFMDEDACYPKLVDCSTPTAWPARAAARRQRLGVHRRHRDPVLDYHCGACGRVFNAFTGTALQGTHRRPVADPADPPRHRPGRRPRRSWPASWAATASTCWSCGTGSRSTPRRWLDRNPLGDDVVEADEMYQNAGEKGIPHPDPDDPPRRRANSRRGHGTFANDRPPVAGVVGRESGEVRLEVLDHAGGGRVGGGRRRARRLEGTTVNTDEWSGYNRVGRRHGRVHGRWTTRGRSARGRVDDDGDGVREVHCNTHGGAVDGAAELPAAVPGGEQVVPGAVRGDLPVGPQHQESHG